MQKNNKTYKIIITLLVLVIFVLTFILCFKSCSDKNDIIAPEYSVSEEYDFHSPFESWVISADNKLFDEVYEGILAIGPDIILSHEPLNLPFGVNISGHDHAGKPVKKSAHSISFNLAANVIGYEPKRLDHLLEGAKYDDVHRLAIDKAIEKKKKRMK